ncbi:hypothetical protein L198_07140 [Cryptococcus wingfieldii CBS 7118]|uniref:F-box domain-containing protein n=1 Tax=Cryptococcus wingfieldii CBS 7118 TaxID=1295528 RepID=A0A1E3IF44_9TREE|nr:hypothetical protein L198_07140 [Cryptococcus wingfieldii CBS 7118]ODN87138.1 hypothetical protein L198_07140 [Cryptococcus wingfieldii CBS 7118]
MSLPGAALDPLLRLDPSITLEILYLLPLHDLISCQLVSKSWNTVIDSYSTSIYRNLSLSILYSKRYSRLKAAADAPETTRISSSDALVRGIKVDWKAAVKKAVMEEKNWKYGRATTKWLTPGSNAVWRQKIDPEEQVLYTVSRIGGIQAHTLAAPHTPLFEYVDTAPYGHLEFTKGYLIFNIENHYEVHLTPPALARLSPEKKGRIPNVEESATYGDGWSHTKKRPWQLQDGETLRGHLTYYRSISTPTDCFAFRARTDREGTDKERPVVGFAGATHAYIYGLANDGYVESYSFAGDIMNQDVNYIEFDDDFLFVCGDHDMRTFSRHTHKALSTFPEMSFEQPLHVFYSLFPNEEKTALPVRTPSGPVEKPARAELVWLDGWWIGDSDSENNRIQRQASLFDNDPLFNACHYTSRDLFCSNISGILYVLRSYREVLSIPDPAKRQEAITRHLLLLDVGGDLETGERGEEQMLNQLATCGEKVVFNTNGKVYVLDAASLPAPPYDPPTPSTPSAPCPQIRLLSLLDVHQHGLRHSSSLQMDDTTIYLVYWAQERVRNGGDEIDISGAHLTASDLGMCVKAWDFGWEE